MYLRRIVQLNDCVQRLSQNFMGVLTAKLTFFRLPDSDTNAPDCC